MSVVEWSRVQKDLDKLPQHIVDKFINWVKSVEMIGIRKVRMNKGFHDEPLKGQRLGQRSVRLNRKYRVIYKEHAVGNIEIINVLEVNNHEY